MISIITCTNKPGNLSTILENYRRQSWKEKELILVLNHDSIQADQWIKETSQDSDVSVHQLSEEKTLGECMNFAISEAKYPYVAKFDDDDFYARDHLIASMESLKESGARVVGKTSIYMYFEEEQALYVFNPYLFAPDHEQVSENRYDRKVMMGGTLLFEKSVAEEIPFEACNTGEDAKFCEACIKRKIPIYSGTKEHYVYIRKPSTQSHTWKIKNDKLKRFCTPIIKTEDFKKHLGYC